jgi:hypothetical protein
VYIGLTISDNKILIIDTSLELFHITIKCHRDLFSCHEVETYNQTTCDKHVSSTVIRTLVTESERPEKEMFVEADPTRKSKPLSDITASCDGIWNKEGHTSNYGPVCVVDVVTGIVDFNIISKYCQMCNINISK